MKLIDKLKCKHKNLETITNIHGDAINMYDSRSMKSCIDCGKRFRGDILDKNCKRTNKFELKTFHLVGETLEDVSDGCHTFNELYYHRMVLFSTICNQNKELAWKSYKHSDGEIWDGYFIVGITTPKGDYTYHYKNECWDYFKIKEVEYAPKYDGHKPEDITRLFSLLEDNKCL